MRNCNWARYQILTKLLVLVVCAMLLLVLSPMASAGESSAVMIEVIVGPCIHVSPDCSVISNISTVSLEDCGTLTVLAR